MACSHSKHTFVYMNELFVMLSSNYGSLVYNTFANIIYHLCLHLFPVSSEPFHQQVCINGIW